MILVLRIAGHPAMRSQLYVFDGLAEGFTKLASEPVFGVHYNHYEEASNTSYAHHAFIFFL